MKHQLQPCCAHPGAYAMALSLVLSLMPALAAAQTQSAPSRPERPYRGLFGGGQGNTAQSLTFDASLGGGTSDGSGRTQAIAGSSGGAAAGSGSLSGSASLSYSMNREKVGFAVSNMILLDYYGQPSESSLLPKDYATASLSFSPVKATQAGVGMTYKNVPELSASDLFEGALGEVVPLQQDLRYRTERYNRYSVSGDVSQQISSRGSASVGLSYSRGMLKKRAWSTLLYSASVSYRITKGLGAYGGYQDGGQRDEGPDLRTARVKRPRMSFGLDYNRPLSFSRKTTMAFSTGTAGTYDRSLDETSYFLIGSVRLDREIGQTWSAGLVYGRNVRYIESLGIPLLADTGTFALQGSFSRRLQFKGRLGASSGNLVGEGSAGSSAGSTKTETYFGSAQLSMALTRQLALSADYAYYQYTLPVALLQTGGPGKNNYQSVRVQLQVWVPLMTRTKTGG